MVRLKYLITLAALGLITLMFSNTYAQSQNIVISPLKQLKAGVAVSDIKCKQYYVLIIKAKNGEPSCVHLDILTRLLAHGWVTVEKVGSIHHTIALNHSEPIQKQNATNQSIINQNKTSVVYNKISTNVTNNGTNSSSDNPPTSMVKNCNDPFFPPITSPLSITPIRPNTVKIVCVGMYPLPPKVGHSVDFTVTFQNISDESIHEVSGCDVIRSLHYTISPSSKVLEHPGGGPLCAAYDVKVEPNQTYEAHGQSANLNGYYQIIKPGMLNVSLDLYGLINSSFDLIETVQFNVNATQ